MPFCCSLLGLLALAVAAGFCWAFWAGLGRLWADTCAPCPSLSLLLSSTAPALFAALLDFPPFSASPFSSALYACACAACAALALGPTSSSRSSKLSVLSSESSRISRALAGVLACDNQSGRGEALRDSGLSTCNVKTTHMTNPVVATSNRWLQSIVGSIMRAC